MALEGFTYHDLADHHGIHLPTLKDPVDVVDLPKSQYLSDIWRNASMGAPFGEALAHMMNGSISKVIAATDNPRKAALYEYVFDSFNLARLIDRPVRVESLTTEQKKAMGTEPDWNNVLYVAAHKNMMARHQRPDLNGMVFSTDILTGAVLPDGGWKIFHKLGRIEDLREEALEERAQEIAEIMARRSTWFWLSGTVMQTKSGIMFAGRYFQAEYENVSEKAVRALFVRDFQRGKAQSIPHGVDVLTDLENYAHDGVGMGITWPMMKEDRNLTQGFVREHVERSLHNGEVSTISIRNLNAMMLAGVPALDGISNVHWERPQSAIHLEKVMNVWMGEAQPTS